jgi:hypothetical protein
MAQANNDLMQALDAAAKHQQMVINTRLTALQAVQAVMNKSPADEPWDAERAVKEAKIFEAYILEGLQSTAELAQQLANNKPRIINPNR